MSAGPIRGIRFIHTALRREAAELAQRAESIAPEQAPALRERAAFLARAARLHNEGEEAALFPEIDAKVPGFSQSYLDDHQDEQAMFARLSDSLARASSDPSALGEARSLAAAIHRHLDEHARKEEEIAVPLVEQHFTPAEQGAHVGRMMGAFTPADLTQILPWMVGRLDPEDRIAWWTLVKRASPPERAAAIAGMLERGLPADIWAPLAAV